MLYDLKWERPTLDDLLTVERLIVWLETQDPETRYSIGSAHTCLIGQFCAAHGVADPPYIVPPVFGMIAMFDIPWTFGAALDRAKALRDAGCR